MYYANFLQLWHAITNSSYQSVCRLNVRYRKQLYINVADGSSVIKYSSIR